MDKFEFQVRAYQAFWNCIDWLFPPECIGCGREGTLLCPECRRSLEYAALSSCIYCGESLPERGVCSRCANNNPHAFKELRYVASFQGVWRIAIHRLKYEGDLGVALTIADMMAHIVESTDWQPELVMPIPLSEKRQTQRGYNQAARLAYPLSLKLRLPLNTSGLVRMHETKSQVSLSFKERQVNVRGAFLADPNVVKDKVILLIDDVFTTGATMNAAASALQEAGCAQVFALTAAKALRRANFIENANSIDV